MVEPGSSGHGPEVHSGPDDIAFVDMPRRDRLRRSNTMPKKAEGGILGFLGNLRKSKHLEPVDYARSRSLYDDGIRGYTDTEREDRYRRKDRKRRSAKINADVEGFVTDAGAATEPEDAEARRAERKARKAARLAQHEAEHEAREAELREAEERRARRREEKARAREEREMRAREEEERRREERRARKAARLAREEAERRLWEEEEQRAADEEAAREVEAKSARRREKRRMREADEMMVDEDDKNGGYRSDRRQSHAPMSRDKYGDEYPTENRRRHSHRSGDENRSKRRRSTADDRHSRRKSRYMDDMPYPAMVHGGKDKTSSWVNSQKTDPPEVVPLAETVIDVPGADPHTHSLSSDEEMRRAIHRRKKHNRHGDLNEADHERRARRRERRAEREAVRSSEGSGDLYDRYGDKYAHANGNSKMTSWFKKLTSF